MSIKQKLLGTWKLIHSVEFDADGNKPFYPFGQDVVGYIMYDDTGHMAVQITRAHRDHFEAESFKSAAKEALATLPQNYLAYCGRYDIDETQELVLHHIEGCLFPNAVGKTVARKYHFYDDKLSLKPWDGTNREILWQKVK